MREIKFRAWDEMKKVMHNDFKFIESGVKGNDWIIFISDKYPLENHETNPFKNPNPYFSQQLKKMQFTGLKDKNGKEIYEGDIVKTDCGIKKIRFIEGMFVAHSDSNYTLNQFREIEVIGNIYENPALLED